MIISELITELEAVKKAQGDLGGTILSTYWLTDLPTIGMFFDGVFREDSLIKEFDEDELVCNLDINI